MLNEEQLHFYQENGYLLVEGVLAREECAAYRSELHDLAARLSQQRSIDATWGSARDVTKQATQLLHCHDVQFYLASFGRLMCDPRITDLASQVMGTPNVQLHHNKMFIKPPEKGSPFPMHQDAPYFPHLNHSMIAAIIHFDDAPVERGCVRVVPGSHRQGMLPHLPEGGWHLAPEEYPVNEALPLPAKAGDVLLFSYLTVHGSGVNESDEARTTWLIQMRDPSDPPTIDTHLSRGQGAMLRGIDPLDAPELAGDENDSLSHNGAMGGGMMGGMAGGMGTMSATHGSSATSETLEKYIPAIDGAQGLSDALVEET